MKIRLVISSDGEKFYVDCYPLKQEKIFGGQSEKRFEYDTLAELKTAYAGIKTDLKKAVDAYKETVLEPHEEIIDL
jgi:hypothetical protein